MVLAAGRPVWIGNSQLRLIVGSEPGEPFQPDADLAVPVPVAEKRPEPRTSMTLLLAGLPLIAGLALALLTGMWFFLAFSAMSLLAAAVPYAAGRRQRRRYRAAVAAAAEADARRRRLAAPDAAALTVSLLRTGTPARGATVRQPAGQPTPAHAWLRLGTASLPAHIGSAEAPVAEPPLLENVPLCVDLLAEPSLRFEGTAQGLDGMLRSVLLQAAARAGGSGLQVVCYALPEPTRSAARFLPGVELAAAALGSWRSCCPPEAAAPSCWWPDAMPRQPGCWRTALPRRPRCGSAVPPDRGPGSRSPGRTAS